MPRDDRVRDDVRAALSDPRQLCERLGIAEGARRNAGDGMLIRCPIHGERNPSCGVTRGPDGTVRWRCFGCQETGDALDLVAVVHGLEARRDFVEVLAVAAELAGMHGVADDLRADREPREYERPPRPEPPPPVEYPDPDEVTALWRAAVPVQDDREACATLVRRRIDPLAVDEHRLWRVVPPGATLPTWAAYGSRSWVETGHRLLLRTFDAAGIWRSVRAWRLIDDDTPKRLPPAKRRSSGLVLANRRAVAMLLGCAHPPELVICEGEPDALTWMTRSPQTAVIGIGSGWWTEAHAARIPRRCDVIIRTHLDAAGEKYAEHIAKTIGDRCPVYRKASAA